MRKILIGLTCLGLISSLLGCSSNIEDSAHSSELPNTIEPEVEKPTIDSNLIKFNELYEKAIKPGEKFICNGVEATLVKATKSVIFVGDNPNEGTIGIRIFIDYPFGEDLHQRLFKIIDENLNEHGHIEADGLDFLGENRGELGMDENGNYKIGYIRAGVPDGSRFMLKFNDSGKDRYIAFTVIEEE